MRIVNVETLISSGVFPSSEEWESIRESVYAAVSGVDWPVGSGSFTIYPESGKKRGEGNGVKPIKNSAIETMRNNGWIEDHAWPILKGARPGNIDAVYESAQGLVAFEWETGNISSSHRSINKLCLGLMQNIIVGGILVVPSRELYPYLTDRIGNIAELEPYFPLWSSVECENGVLQIIVIEHDEISYGVPRIPKGTDGRALL